MRETRFLTLVQDVRLPTTEFDKADNPQPDDKQTA